MVEHKALLLTDVVDSVRLAESLGVLANSLLWAAHDRVARDLLPAWRGREIDKTDGMLLLFESATDAVGYAMAYQRSLRTLTPPLMARAGLHVGPITMRANSPSDVARGAKPIEVEGAAKAIAARVMSVAMGGQILLTASARGLLRAEGLRLQSHGHWRLKGLAEPAELFEVGSDDGPFTPPPNADKAYRVTRQGDLWLPVRKIPHSLPAERDAFVGRAQVLVELSRRIQSGARLVSVLGIGGGGKTRLATRFGWTWLGDFPGGVWFCDLSTARDLDGLLRSVAQGLGVPLGGADPVVQLAHAIDGHGRCLLILDNFEQVVRLAEETLGVWLDRAGSARFVVTSRERLGLVGEETLELEPMPAAEAIALFQRRAQAVAPGEHAAAADHAAIEQLVGMLDGLPLAIELAAARARVMAPRAMLARMNERFGVLLSRSGRPDRQATLRAAFDWSWELLTEPEKAALAQLSVFVDGLTLEAAEAVLDLPGPADEVPPAIDVLHGLVDKSLVRRTSLDRFNLLQSVRAYAAEHLCTEGRYAGSGAAAVAAASRRHAAYFAALGPTRAVEGACAETGNLTAACRHAIAIGDGALAAETLRGASAAINRRGPFRVLPALAEAVRAVPELTGRARVLVELDSASAHRLCGLASTAQQLWQTAAAGARALGERSLEARALNGLASLAAEAGRVDDAAALYDRALAALDDGVEADLQCAVLNGLAAFEDSRGQPEAARRHYEEALGVARTCGMRRWEGGSAGNLGQWFASQGYPAEARSRYTLAIEIARELGDRQWEANARCNLGLLHFEQGQLAEAQGELDASNEAASQLGHTRLAAIVRCNLGLLAEAQNRGEAAEAHYRAALAIVRELGDRRSEGQFLGYLGLLRARSSDFGEAREDLAAGQALLEAQGDRLSLGILLSHRAQAEALAGEHAIAEAFLARADTLARQMPDLGQQSEFGRALQRARSAVAAG